MPDRAEFHQASNRETNTMAHKATYWSALGANRWVTPAPKDARVIRTVLPLSVHRPLSSSTRMHGLLNSASEGDQLGLVAIRDLC